MLFSYVIDFIIIEYSNVQLFGCQLFANAKD